jgi:hypothetical protein
MFIFSPPVPPFRVGEKNRRRKRIVSFDIEYCFMNSTGWLVVFGWWFLVFG